MLKDRIVSGKATDSTAWLHRARLRLLGLVSSTPNPEREHLIKDYSQIPTGQRAVPPPPAGPADAPPVDRAAFPHRDRPLAAARQRARVPRPPPAPEVVDLCSDSDAETVRVKRSRVKRERSSSPMRRVGPAPRAASQRAASPRVAAAPTAASAAGAGASLIPAGYRAGVLMPLAEFCQAYYVGARVRDVLTSADYNHSHTLKFLNPRRSRPASAQWRRARSAPERGGALGCARGRRRGSARIVRCSLRAVVWLGPVA
jgi:hypothetical protein